MKLYSAMATCLLAAHLLFVLWVVFGAFVARHRPVLRWIHIASLMWGILAELFIFPCPLTALENWLELRSGIEPYQGGFLLHYLDKMVYPNICVVTLTVVAVIACALNLSFYAWQLWVYSRSKVANESLARG